MRIPHSLVADGLLSHSRDHAVHDRARRGVDCVRACSTAAATSRTSCARAWSWLILKTTGVPRAASRGSERITPGTTYVFVSNHQSIYDTPVIFASLPFYQLRIIAKESLARFPVLGWHLRRGGHLFVDRRHPGSAAASSRRWRARGLEGPVARSSTPRGTAQPRRAASARFAGRQLARHPGWLPIVPIAGDRHATGDAEGRVCVPSLPT